MIYRFGQFVLDADRFALLRDGCEVALQPRALELLLLLVRERGRMLSKEHIQREIWGGLYVSPSALPSQIKAIRQALGDHARPRNYIETVHGKGVRFIADVEERAAAVASASDGAAPLAELAFDEDRRTRLIGHQPMIAVLPFACIGEGRPLAGLAQALPMDMIVALSRLRMLRVIARGSAFLLGAELTAPSTVRMVLGADYSLSGAVSLAGENYCVTVELASTASQEVVWANQFEVEPRDIHELRRRIVSNIVTEIENQVPQHEARRLLLRDPESLTAWQAFHTGSSLIYRRGRDNMLRARTYFERAVAIDPAFARAHAGIAHTYAFEKIHGSPDAAERVAAKLMRSAEKAVDADPDDPAANLFMGRAHAAIGEAVQARGWFERSIDLSPSYAMAHQQMASIHAFTGVPKEALRYGETSLVLSPQDPLRFSNYAALCFAAYNSGEVEHAIRWGIMAGQVPHDDMLVLLTGLFANHLAGHHAAAKELADRVHRRFPQATIASIESANPIMNDVIRPFAQQVLQAHGFH